MAERIFDKFDNMGDSRECCCEKKRDLGTVIIDNMTEQDGKAVQELFRQCFSVPWSEESIHDMFCTGGYVNLVARQEKEIIGYIGIKAVLDEADIINVAVSSSWRRQGLGRRLLQRLLTLATEKNITHIFLEVRVSNLPAMTLYEQAGFQKIDVRKNYYEKPREDACIMRWDAGQ